MAYVVGSASVEIVPDFRNAQRKITEFFASQGNTIKAPIDFEVNEATATRARTASAKVQRDITEDTRKATIERQAMYERLFKQVDAQAERSDKAQTQSKKQAAAEQNAIYKQLLAEQAAADRSRAQQQTQFQREQARVQAQAQKDAAREYQRLWVDLLNEQDRAQQTSAENRRRQDEANSRTRLNIERNIIRESTELTRQEVVSREAMYGRMFDTIERQSVSAARRLAQQLKEQAKDAGNSFGEILGSTILTNFQREVRARSAFIATVIGATLIAGAPVFLGAATTLFGGLGLAATASSAQVKEVWRGTWQGILADTRSSAGDFVAVHTGLADRVATEYAKIRPSLDKAFEAAAPLTQQFGDALIKATATTIPGFTNAIQHSQPVMAGFGNLLDGIARGLNGFFTNLVSEAPAAGNVLDSLGNSLSQLLPAIGELLAVGANLSSTLLPLLTAGLTVLNGALNLMAPILPVIATGLASLKIAGVIGSLMTVAGSKLATFAQNAAFATYNSDRLGSTMTGKVADGASRASGALARTASAISSAGIALPILGAGIALVATQMSNASAKTDEWAQQLNNGTKSSKQFNEEYLKQFGGKEPDWLGHVAEWAGLASSMDEAKNRAAELRAEMSPLERAQSIATQRANELKLAIQEYGAGSDEVKDATRRNSEAQAALGVEQRKVNDALRDTIPSAEAAKTALEDYQAALAQGDVDGAASALRRYSEETAEAAEETRVFNVATRDTVSSSEAAKLALKDYQDALLNDNVPGATEALSRYKQESYQATQEQIALDAALGVTGTTFEGYPGAVSSAQLAMLQFNSTQGATQQAIDLTIARIDEWRSAVQGAVDGFVEPMDTYRRMLEAKSESERKTAQSVADNTVSSKDSWRDYLETTKVTLKEYNDALVEQQKAQLEWKNNLVLIAAVLGDDVARELAEMGKDGATLVAQMADDIHGEGQRTAELLRQDMNDGGDGAVAALDTKMRVLAEVGRRGGKDTAEQLARELEAGTITVAQIAERYGINLAAGVNPVLSSLGKPQISTKVRPLAEGAVLAPGGGENHVAEIAPAGAWRVWAEDETGGEAYIPLHPSKRQRSLAIWQETGKRLGVQAMEFAQGSIVDMGRRLQAMGARVAEHPAFPPLSMTGHGKTSLHYTGHAIDVNTRPGTSALEQRELAPMAALARSLGFRTIFMAPDHYNHLHVDDGGGPNMGTVGFAAPITLPKPPSTAPYREMIGVPADESMLAAYNAAQEWVNQNMSIPSEGEGGGPVGAGVQQWRGLVLQALAMKGQPASLVDTVLRRMQQESGGNPRAVNNWDINAKRGTPSKGLLQTIDPTFQAYRDRNLPNDVFNPLANIIASMNYAISRYGSLSAAYNRAGGYAEGGILNPHVRDAGGPLLPGYTYNGTGRPEEVVLASSAINGFRAMLGTNGTAAPMPRLAMGQGSTGGEGAVTSVNGFVNNGTVVVSNMAEVERQAENSKRASLAAMGLL